MNMYHTSVYVNKTFAENLKFCYELAEGAKLAPCYLNALFHDNAYIQVLSEGDKFCITEDDGSTKNFLLYFLLNEKVNTSGIVVSSIVLV